MMADLEEQLLKKNVPGRYSSFWQGEGDYPIEHDAESISSNDCHNDNIVNTFNNDVKHQNDLKVPRTIAAGSANTGVKGVLADFRSYKREEAMQREYECAKQWCGYHLATEGTKLSPGEHSFSISDAEMKAHVKKDVNTSNSDSEFSSDLDEEFFSSYRSQRLMELQNTHSMPTFGCISELKDTVEFSQAIDDVDSRIFCIIHLYDDAFPQCALMNEHLVKLARKMKYCHFFILKTEDLFEDSFDPIGYPCLLVYKNKREVANLTPITGRFRNRNAKVIHSFTAEEVESVLRDVGVIYPCSPDTFS